MPHRQIYIDHGGQKFAGTFELEGDILSVSSAYGSQSGKLARRRPETLAATLLQAIVADYKQRQVH